MVNMNKTKLAAVMDYETLHNYGVSAKAISCGMLAFDVNGNKNEIVDSNGHIIARHFSHLIRHSDEDQPGRISSAETIKWWSERPAEVRKRVFDENLTRLTVEEHLRAVRAFIKKYDIGEVWANSPRFDLNILHTLWLDIFPDERFPISYKVERDVRSIEQFIFGTAEMRYQGGILHYGEAHNELDDCVTEAFVIQAAHQFRNAAIEALGDPREFVLRNFIN